MTMYDAISPPGNTVVSETDFRHALGHFASGVTIITTMDGQGAVHGMTATAFSSLSMRPPQVLVAVKRGTRCHRQIISGGRFGVSILHDHQVEASQHFGGKPSSDFEPAFETFVDVPTLADAMANLACTVDDPPVAGGDHSIFIGSVRAVRVAGGRPLIHFGGRYRTLAD